MSRPLVVRPRRLTLVCRLVALLIVATFVVVTVGLGRTEGGAGFRWPDQVAMLGLGLLLGGGVLVFTRARVVADADGVRVRNAWRESALPWQVVAAVRFDEASPWASLDLHDDDTLALLAVQANDGPRAVAAVAQLRALLEAARGDR